MSLWSGSLDARPDAFAAVAACVGKPEPGTPEGTAPSRHSTTRITHCIAAIEGAQDPEAESD